MQARLADSGRGRAAGHAILALGLLLAVLGWGVLITPGLSHFAGLVEAAGLVLVFLAGTFGRWRRPSRAGTLTLLPGKVTFMPEAHDPRRLLPPDVIRARDVLGATTASTPGGVTLAIARASRPADPTHLTLANESDAEDVRRVLGIGHGGRGAVMWRTYVPKDERVSRLLAAAFALFAAETALTDASESAMFTLTILALNALPILAGLWAVRSAGHRILLSPHHLELYIGRPQPELIPYGAITAVSATPKGILLHLSSSNASAQAARTWRLIPIWTGGHPLAAMSSEARDVLAAQIEAAAHRAQGRTRPREDASARLESLRRGRETAASWLAKLDALAASLLQTPGYRGPSIDAADLWTVLEDPDADLELRCAAARVLTKQMDTLPISHSAKMENRTRVATALAAGEPEIERKLRLAVDVEAFEVDDASFADLHPEQLRRRGPSSS